MIDKKSHSRMYRIEGQLIMAEKLLHPSETLIINLPYRKAMSCLDTSQVIWEGFGAKVTRTRAMVEAKLDTITFRIWLEKE
ncbi:MAG: hypothetical protein ABIO63_09010 [Casimicrobiaceae bacterium]